MIERSVLRVVPQSPVTISVRTEGGLLAFGVVANISPRGACLFGDMGFEPGTPLQFTLSFPREGQPVEAPGRVVWVQPYRDGQMRCGLEFETLPDDEAARLATLVGRVAPH